MEERRGESISETMKKVGSISKSADLVLMADVSRKLDYLEGPDSTISYQGSVYNVDEIIAATKGLPVTTVPLDKLKWMVEGDTNIDMARVNKADLRYPVIVQKLPRGLGRYATLDGYHRVVKAIKRGDTLIKAIVVDQSFIDKLTKTTLGNESFITKAEAIQAAQKGCDEHGIDSTLDPQERITRYIDIMHGSPHTKDELARKVSLENNDDRNKKREATEKRVLSKIRSQDFKKLLESLNGKTQDQDYERILGLLGVIEQFGLKDVKVKKAYDNFLSPNYLSKVPEEDRQETAVHEIRKVYMYVRDNLMKKG